MPDTTPPIPPPNPILEPPNPPKFTNLWLAIPPTQRVRTTILIPSRTYSDFAKLHPKSGVLQTTICQLIEKLTHELKRVNFTEYDPARYELAIAGCSIQLGGEHYLITNADPAAPDAIDPGVIDYGPASPVAAVAGTAHRSPTRKPTTRPVDNGPAKTPKRNVRRGAN